MIRTPREAIQASATGLAAGLSILSMIEEVARRVESIGFGDRVTTRQIRRQLIRTGRV